MGLIDIAKSIYEIVENQIAQAGVEEQKDHERLDTKPPAVVATPVKFDPNNIVMSVNGNIELGNYEGLALTKYIDSGGVQTVGLGMTVSEIKDLKSWAWDKQLTVQECCDMFKKGLVKYQDALNKAVIVPLKQHEFDALLSWTYNVGIGAMQGSTLIRRLNNGDNKVNVANSLLNWKYDNGVVVKGLLNRRNAERDLFLTGKYQNKGTVALITVNPTTHKPSYKNTINLTSYF